jgi:cobalt-zinc-cadmium efflux system membrane fusion protein
MKKYINKKTIIIGLLFISLAGFFLLKNYQTENNKAEEEPKTTVSDVIALNPDAIKGAGISTFTVFEKPLVSQIITTGEIKANEDKKFTINSITTGRIIQDSVKLGDYIKQGQTVAVIQNPEVTQINANSTQQLHENRISIRQAQTRYSLAKMNYEREKRLFKEGISPQKDYIQAQSDMIIAKDELANLKERTVHIKSEARAMLGTYGVSANLNSESLITSSPITALRSGVVTKKNITVGSVVAPDQILYEVSDLKQLWLDITLYSKDIAKIKDGQTVIFKSDSFPDQEFIGKIDYIQPASNEPTQTFIARAFINNPLGFLKPGMFGEIVVSSNIKANKPFIPEEAIQKYGKETFVFLDSGNGKYKKQVVQVGEKAIGGHFINSGVQAGDKIVGTGSFTLKSELLKSEFAEEE